MTPEGAAVEAGLAPGRVTLGLEPMPYARALEAVVRPAFGADPARLAEVAGALARAAQEVPAELVPGVVFPSTRVEGLDEALVFAGVCPAGIDFPHATAPARLVFALVSPRDDPEEHLEHLSRVARLVATADDVDRLCRCESPAQLFEWFRAGAGADAAP
jgi:mannitol/fructose-specific phosphotransferase system IIA component (Ntr-type)